MESVIQTLFDEMALWLPNLGIAVVLLLTFYLLSRVVKGVIGRAAVRFYLDAHLTSLFARSSGIVIMAFGVVTALGTLGINVSALVAGLGLTGFALGFALKDTISNFLSGILILLYRPFKVGERIKIAGFDGTVIAIDLRYTELDSEGDRVLIPNSKLFTDPITVVSLKEGAASAEAEVMVQEDEAGQG